MDKRDLERGKMMNFFDDEIYIPFDINKINKKMVKQDIKDRYYAVYDNPCVEKDVFHFEKDVKKNKDGYITPSGMQIGIRGKIYNEYGDSIFSSLLMASIEYWCVLNCVSYTDYTPGFVDFIVNNIQTKYFDIEGRANAFEIMKNYVENGADGNKFKIEEYRGN